MTPAVLAVERTAIKPNPRRTRAGAPGRRSSRAAERLPEVTSEAETSLQRGELILRAVTVVDGTGAPAYGPADVVITGGRISKIQVVGSRPPGDSSTEERPTLTGPGTEMRLDGHYLLPGIVDCHAHIGPVGKVPSTQYVYNLWLSHGITAVRELGCVGRGLQLVRDEAGRSDSGDLIAPAIVPYALFGEGNTDPPLDSRGAGRWLETIAREGASGVKFFGYQPEVYRDALSEARRLGLRTACHHRQRHVRGANALDSARWGLSSIEHGYGLPEALAIAGAGLRPSLDYNDQDEAARFSEAANPWLAVVPPDSQQWREVIAELVSLGVTLDPTFNVYDGLRDAARVRNAEWHAEYTAPQLWQFFQPSRDHHGSCFFDWTTDSEVRWKHAFATWMNFVADFHASGGRVTLGTDAGFLYKIYGFAAVEEMELLQEAGLHPLEVIRAATLAGAELLGMAGEIGSVQVGKRADLLVVEENPLVNLKVLYGHGRFRLGPRGLPEHAGGVKMVIRGGTPYSGADLRAAVREEVAEEWEKSQAGSPAAVMRPPRAVGSN